VNRSKLADRYQQDGLATIPPSQLVVRLYERLQRDLEQAKIATTAEQVEEAHKQLVHAQDIVYELNLALDLDVWPEGDSLAAVYQYLSERLIEANLRKSTEIVDDCLDQVRPLVEAWQQALTISQRERATAMSSAAGAGAVGTYTA